MNPTTARLTLIATLAAVLLLAPLPTRSQQDKDVRVVAIEGADRAAGKKWALMVGIDNYDDPGITPLRYAVADVRAMEQTLRENGADVFDSIKVLSSDASLQDKLPTRSNILASVKAMTELARENDTLVLFFSGHGITEHGKNFLVPMDAKLSLLADTAVPLERIYDYFDASPAKAQLIVLDACHSGVNREKKDLAGMDKEFLLRADGRMTLSSSDIKEPAYEWEEQGHGVFTYYLVQGLTGEADANGDTLVTAKEAEMYTTSKVRDWGFQTGKVQNPRVDSNISGDIVLTRVREQVEPAPDVARPEHTTPIQPDTRPDLDRATTGDVFLSVKDEWGAAIHDYVVEIAGSRVSASPGEPVSDLKEGTHSLTVKARGYYDKSVNVYVDPGKIRSEDVVLKRLRGMIAVKSEPAGADVLIDGGVAGKTNDVFGDLIDGREYTVKVWKEGYSPSEEKKVTIVGERTTDLSFALLSLPTLEVIANVEGFTLLVDGYDKGKSSGQSKKITVDEPKTVSVKVQKEGYQDWSKSGISLKAGAMERVTAEMIRRNLLLITAKVATGKPSDADNVEVLVDGKSCGRLSNGEMKVWDLPAGAHDVTIKTGKENIDKNAYVSDGKTAMIELEFARDDLRPGGMVYIPAGSFTMGCSPGDDKCEDDEKPAMNVTISKGFYMDATEVTQGDYERVMGKNPSHFKDCGADCPVEQVSWNDAKSYCEKVGKRLPTEAEWEYAARSGTTTKYYWGNSMDGAYAWYDGNSGNKTHAVGQKKPNGFGLYDMAGNVWEWVSDCYDSDWYSKMHSRDPVNTCTGSGNRVLRGGSWYSNAGVTRVSDRNGHLPTNSYYDLGFRCSQD